ncbi:MAG TPA: putative porin [Pyrinomonadaceae bacterium]|nr:putative porin [Pyrinomonadaceae bacterium]
MRVRSLLSCLALLSVMGFWDLMTARGQSVTDNSVSSVHEAPRKPLTDISTTRATKGTDGERIAVLEQAVQAQEHQLHQLRLALEEQNRLLNELRVLARQNAPAVPSANPTEPTLSQAASQASVSDRLAAVEAQNKKTSETVSKQIGSMTFSGDLRLRFESFFGLSNSVANAANPSVLGNELTPRYRPRIRVRFAVRGKINDEFDWGLRFATGSFADNISTNQTFTDFFNRKPFGLDQAFVTYKPKELSGLRIQGGRFEAPWTSTEMVFDNDLQFEGVNESYSREFKGTLKNLTLVAWQLPMLERNSAFVRNPDGTVNVDQSRRGGRDLALYGAQVRTRFEPNAKVALTVALADHYFSGTQFISPVQVFGSQLQLPVTFTIPASGSAPTQTISTQVSIPRDMLVAGNSNLGVSTATNNATNRDGRLSSGFNLVDLIARLELKHNRRFPVTLLFDVVSNTQTHDVVIAGHTGANALVPNDQGTGYWAEIQVGKSRERGDLLFGYTFMRIEKDAVLTPFNFSDITQQSDMRGHRFNFAYVLDPKVVFSLTGIITERPHGLLGVFGNTPPGSLNRATTRLQFDTSFRF